MAQEHWFDRLHRTLSDEAPRRGLLRTAGALVAALVLDEAPRSGAAKRNKGKGKGKGKGNKKGKSKTQPPSRCGEDMCAAEWPDDDVNRNDCELKCGRCRIRENFCIVAGDPNIPDNLATCCFEHQRCCLDLLSASGMVCVDTMTDIDHCGRCENPCPFGMVCVSGRCSCPDGTTFCPDGCVDILTDPRNCRGCGDECPEDWECCGGDCADTQFSPTHCGLCDFFCPIGEGAPGSCCNGVCTNTLTDAGNCGQCGRQCDPGQICCRGNCWGADVTCCPNDSTVCGGDNVCCQDEDGLWGCCSP